MNKKVLFVVGSLREKSFNRTVAEYISKRLEEKVGLALPAEAFQIGIFNLSDEQKLKLDNEIKAFMEN